MYGFQVNTRQQTERKAKASNAAHDADAALVFTKAYPVQKVQRGTIQEIIKVCRCCAFSTCGFSVTFHRRFLLRVCSEENLGYIRGLPC